MRLNWINAVLAFMSTFYTQVGAVDFLVQKLQFLFSELMKVLINVLKKTNDTTQKYVQT